MTPREFFIELEAARARREDEADRDTALAWRMVALFFRTLNEKRLPDPVLLMNSARAPAETPSPVAGQSRETQRRILIELSERYKIPLQIRKH